ncbi:MAG: hypothetical protein R3B84_06565 [Zavarzinella sp.]
MLKQRKPWHFAMQKNEKDLICESLLIFSLVFLCVLLAFQRYFAFESNARPVTENEHALFAARGQTFIEK